MACCNQKRTAFQYPQTTPPKNDAPRLPSPAEVFFQYKGAKSLIVYGAVTGAAYRFDGPGAFRGVDRRDAPGMMAVPMLERVARN